MESRARDHESVASDASLGVQLSSSVCERPRCVHAVGSGEVQSGAPQYRYSVKKR
jgi:hypothetical protein